MNNLNELRKDLSNKKIHLAIIIISFILSIIFMVVAISSDIYVPFIICLIIYMGSSVISTIKYTFLSAFFGWSLSPGENGCITVPLYIIAFPIISMVSCFIGIFPLISQILTISETIKQLESERKK